MGRSSWVLAAALAILARPDASVAQGLYLHHIPVTRAASRAGAGDAPLRIRAFVADPSALARALPQAAAAIDDGYVELELATYPELEPHDPARYRDASFLIDYDEPSVRALRTHLGTRESPPSLEQLRRLAGTLIPRKSMERGWDSASRVASSGIGDCTEHAVLLTALARAAGWPARVALGLLVVAGEGEELRVFGHAWTEIHQGGHWARLDATPVAERSEVLAYVPIVLLADEGPGFLVNLARQMQRVWVSRVEIAAAAPAAGASRR